MADRELRLKIGAAIDASFQTVFASVTSTVKRARQQIEREMRSGAQAGAAAHKEAGKEIDSVQKKTAKSAEELAKKNAIQMAMWEQQTTRVVEREARARERIKREAAHREMNDLMRQNQRGIREMGSGVGGGGGGGRGRLGNGGTGGRSFLHGFGMSLAYRAGATALGLPGRVAGDVMRGFGMDADISSLLQGSVGRQALGQQIANSAYIPKGGPRGSDVRVSGESIVAKATEAGIATGNDTQDMLEGMQKFVGMTGDLQTIEESMVSLGKIAKANGTDFGDMAQAAAEVSNAMGDIPNKGKAITDVMRALAGQGQLTAIEIRDMAKYVGMVTSQSNFFKIDPTSSKTLKGAGIDNEAGQRIAVVSGLAQFARERGGRVTARQSMQSAMAMVRDMASPTEVKRMQERGLTPYTDGSHSTLRDPVQMILESFKLAQTKGGLNRDVLNKLFPNQQSRAVVNAFSQTYNEEYKKQAEMGVTDETVRHTEALKEVNAAFQRMLNVTQSNKQVEEAFAKTMKGADAQAKVFKDQLGKISDKVMADLLPALISLTPLFLKFAQGLGQIVENLTGEHTSDPTIQMAEDRAEAVLKNTRDKIANKSATPEDEHRMAQTMIDLNNAIAKRRTELGEMRQVAGAFQGGDRKLFQKGQKFAEMSEDNLQKLARQDDQAGKEARNYIELRNQLQKMEATSRELNIELLGKLQTAVSQGLRAGPPIPVQVANPPGADLGGDGTMNPNSTP